MTKEEFNRAWPTEVIVRLIKAACESLNKSKGLHLFYEQHTIEELTKDEKTHCAITIYYRNTDSNRSLNYQFGEGIFIEDTLPGDDKWHITKELAQYQKIILRIAKKLYALEKLI